VRPKMVAATFSSSRDPRYSATNLVGNGKGDHQQQGEIQPEECGVRAMHVVRNGVVA
jgi:hypothetical protein